ncbi:MAG: type II toxin-antitoxin system RelE/ParE family toxin [Hyphomicrobiaceae bacterium]
MRVFKLPGFSRFQRKEGMTDNALCKAVRDAERGLIDADLGRGLIKQRVARPGQGKRGSYRTIIAYRVKKRAVFLFGFAKSGKSNLDPDELEALAKRGAVWLGATVAVIERALATNELMEVDCSDEDEG